jgi:hypothetical protein
VSKWLGRLYPLFLLGLAGLAYGLWINRLGLYWDDFPLAWIARTYGAAGLERYFATNRPFWGLLYRLTTPVLGSSPLAWQVFALFWRWVSGLLLWQLVRLVWPKQEDAARFSAALFVVYPAFSEQYIALVYSHFFIVLSSFLGSLCLMILAARKPRAWGLWAGALALSALNLLCMEYFFLLDLLRPVLVWIVFKQENLSPYPLPETGRGKPILELVSSRGEETNSKPLKTEGRSAPAHPRWGNLIARVGLVYAPFLAIFLGVIVWRTFFFGFHTYQPSFMTDLRAAPLAALLGLAGRALGDLWLTAVQAWGLPFDFSGLAGFTARQVQIFWLAAAGGTLAGLGYFGLTRPAPPQDAAVRRRTSSAPAWEGLSLALVGLLALLLAGGPFWLTGLPISSAFHTDRFTIAFMLGAVLLGVGLLGLLPLPRWAKVIPLVVVLGFSAGLQYRNSISYFKDWSTQRTLFWQMLWRMPGLKPGTILLFNELPVLHYSDNSLTAPLNWIYAPENHTTEMSYVLYYPTVRLGTGLPRLEKGLPVRQDYLAAEFQGDTSQVVVLYFQPPGCVRVMDPEVEAESWLVPPSLRETLKLSSTAPIEADGQAKPPPGLYGSEPERNWCYYFEKADLARQEQDWQAAARLGDQAFALGDYPNDPVERFPFIEAYAHTANWKRALELTRDTQQIAPLYAQLGCRLWARIERETTAGGERDTALQEAKVVLGCGK